MKPRGKVIHHFEKKVGAILEILHSAGRIPKRTLASLAAAADVKYRTLQSSIANSRVSDIVESRLCNLCEFAPTEPAWADLSISEEEREGFDPDYLGRDTIDRFRAMLEQSWWPKRAEFRAIGEQPLAVDRELACHEITDCGQATDPQADFQLFLQSDFGTMYAPNGLKYGFRRARLDMRIICTNGARASLRLGRGAPIMIRNAQIAARGTDRQPSWTIACLDSAANDVLLGEYCTTDSALMALTGYAEGTRIETTLSVSIHEASLCSEGQEAAISANKLALIQLICSMEFSKGRDEAGRVQLCSHALCLTGARP